MDEDEDDDGVYGGVYGGVMQVFIKKVLFCFL